MSHIVIDARKIKSSTGRYVYELLINLEKIDHTNKYTVVVLPSDGDYYTPKAKNFSVVTAPHKHYTFGEQLGFARFLYRLKPDLVHFYMPQQPLAYTKTAVTTVHDLNLLRITHEEMGRAELFIKKKLFAGMLWAVAHRAAHIITPTQYTKDDLVSWAHIAKQKVSVTLEGVYKLDKTKPVPAYKNTPFFMYLGRSEPYKNNRRMIEAHQKLIRTKPELRLVIIGSIDEQRQADIAWVQQKNYKNVDFLGWLSDEEAAWLAQHTIAYVAPSYMEGFGLPALEAMQQGAPVVSANTTCCPEILGGGAIYFDPFDVDAIAQTMERVMTDQPLRKKLIAAGQKQVARYSWRAMAEQTLAIYKKVLKQP